MILISLLIYTCFSLEVLIIVRWYVKRSAREIRRLVVIARSHMYWILKDCTNSVCTPCYASYVSRLSKTVVVLGTVYTCTHVAIRLQAVLIRIHMSLMNSCAFL